MVDAPLLFEANADALCDTVVAVIAPADVRMKRIIARDKLTEAQAKQRMAAQKPDEFYCREGVTVLDGGDNINSLQEQAKQYLSTL